MLVYPDQEAIDALDPDFGLLGQIEARGVIATAPGQKVDFVSRFFAPQSGVDEDPVTGSAHTLLVPYWAARLKKDVLRAEQRSRRGGLLRCTNKGNRILIGGKAVTYMKAELFLP
jgi:predicted PhzF superfamily epimerase YddE/YHI9